MSFIVNKFKLALVQYLSAFVMKHCFKYILSNGNIFITVAIVVGFKGSWAENLQ